MQDYQLGFDQLMLDAHQLNAQRRIEIEHGSLPSDFDTGLIYFRTLIEEHHHAMMAADIELVMKLRNRACALAFRLNGNEPGYLAQGAAGTVLADRTRAIDGQVPHWGQSGSFTVDAAGMRVRIELDGVFGIGASCGYWLGFSTHIVDKDKPFLSETGFRSFLGLQAEPMPELSPDAFASEVVAAHVRQHGRLALDSRYVR